MTRARKETPILFSPEMILAERKGIKDQTRRVARVKLVEGEQEWSRYTHDTAAVYTRREVDGIPQGVYGNALVPVCPYGQAGDLLWVRERMQVIATDFTGHMKIRVRYEADGEESAWLPYPERLKGQPIVGKCLSYGGFREASRTTLELTEVRAQFLDQISIEDILAEGVQYPVKIRPVDDTVEASINAKRGKGKVSPMLCVSGKYPPSDYLPKDWRDPKHSMDDMHHMMLRAHWGSLWDTINFKRGYGTEVNPVVWALSFKRHEGGKNAEATDEEVQADC